MADTGDLKYTKTHEWVRIEGDTAVVGITQHAADELGDVALLQLPEPGRILRQDERLGEIESIKAVSEIYAPVSGEVVAINDELTNRPELVNSDPFGSGWIVKIRAADVSEASGLLDEPAYNALIAE